MSVFLANVDRVLNASAVSPNSCSHVFSANGQFLEFSQISRMRVLSPFHLGHTRVDGFRGCLEYVRIFDKQFLFCLTFLYLFNYEGIDAYLTKKLKNPK